MITVSEYYMVSRYYTTLTVPTDMKVVINYFLNDINTVEFSAIDNRGVTA